jgi:hypothetical protein
MFIFFNTVKSAYYVAGKKKKKTKTFSMVKPAATFQNEVLLAKLFS